MTDKNKKIRRGDIYYADFGNSGDSAQNGVRPALVISNNLGNEYGPTVIVVAVTSKKKKLNMPTHLILECGTGLNRPGIVMAEQVKTMDKSSLQEKVGKVSNEFLEKVDRAISISVGLIPKYNEEPTRRNN